MEEDGERDAAGQMIFGSSVNDGLCSSIYLSEVILCIFTAIFHLFYCVKVRARNDGCLHYVVTGS